MEAGGRKVIDLSNLADRLRVEHDRKSKNSSFVKEEQFIFGYVKAKASVEMFGTYRKILYE